VGYSALQDVGFEVLREFWPQISRKCGFSFRRKKQRTSDGVKPVESAGVKNKRLPDWEIVAKQRTGIRPDCAGTNCALDRHQQGGLRFRQTK
jgi:hypothetical protein